MFRWLKSSVGTAYAWLTDNTLNNVHIEPRADFSQISKIKIAGAILIGTHDGFTGGDPVRYIKNINQHFPNFEENQLIFIENASHIYRNQEKEIAAAVLKQLEQWK